jgi:hypothetical protein
MWENSRKILFCILKSVGKISSYTVLVHIGNIHHTDWTHILVAADN